MNIETLIEKYQLNEAEAQALRFMEQNKSHLKKIGIREVAKQAFISTATIVNMSKKIGFSGYSELVFSMQNPIAPSVSLTNELISDEQVLRYVIPPAALVIKTDRNSQVSMFPTQ